MADNVVQLAGRFGNQLWELSTAIKVFGEENFKANLRHCGPAERASFEEGVRNVRVKEQPELDDFLLPLSYYQHRKFLCQRASIVRCIAPKPANTPSLPCVCHLRLDDYLRLEPYSRCILTRDFVQVALDKLGVDRKDLYVLSDGTEEQVKEHLWDDVNYVNEPRTIPAFWTMIEAENLIMSASSFSYWAGYLNSGKIVPAPVWPCELQNLSDPNLATSRNELLWS